MAYVVLTLVFGALPWLLWADLPIHHGGMHASAAGVVPSKLFAASSPKLAVASATEASRLRGAVAAAAAEGGDADQKAKAQEEALRAAVTERQQKERKIQELERKLEQHSKVSQEAEAQQKAKDAEIEKLRDELEQEKQRANKAVQAAVEAAAAAPDEEEDEEAWEEEEEAAEEAAEEEEEAPTRKQKAPLKNHKDFAAQAKASGEKALRMGAESASSVDWVEEIGEKYLVKDESVFEPLATAPSGPAVRFAKPPKVEDEALVGQRREAVKAAMKRAWDAYKKYAWGQDTLLPLSKTATNRWGSMAMTMLDSLSTLWVMGLKDEFKEAKDWIAENLQFEHVGSISVFETNIRAFAGLLSAYDLSGEKVFLDKAKDLGDRLLKAFDTPTGFPMNGLRLSDGTHTGGPGACLAEFGTLQLEFRSLSHHTGDPIYEERAMHAFKYLYENRADVAPEGVYKLDFNTNTGEWMGTQYSVGARGDSFYEYLLKVWLQGNRREPWLREMFDESVDGIEEMLITRSQPGGRLYLANSDGPGRVTQHMEHLACFYPGTLALGAASFDTKGDKKLEARAAHMMDVARELAETCFQFAAAQVTGLAPDSVHFDAEGAPVANDPRYILRPEVAESMYYLHMLDGDPKWREHAAFMFDAIDTYCRTDEAYAQVRLNVGSTYKPAKLRGGEVDKTAKERLVQQEDEMESFFLAETLKYLYLVQETEPGEVDISKQVFNTEAHPLRIFE